MGKARIWCLDLGMVRAYAIRGEDGVILVDSGVEGKSLETALAKAGIDPGDIVLAVVTHAHADHAGGLAWLESRKKGIPIAVGADDAPARAEGRDTDLVPLGAKGRFAARLSKAGPRYSGLEASLRFSGGESLSPYGLEAEILATPGHTRGSISVLLPQAELVGGGESGCLAIVGDLVMGGFIFHGRPQAPFFASSRADLYGSLERLRERGATTLLPGHGGPLDAGRALAKLGA